MYDYRGQVKKKIILLQYNNDRDHHQHLCWPISQPNIQPAISPCLLHWATAAAASSNSTFYNKSTNDKKMRFIILNLKMIKEMLMHYYAHILHSIKQIKLYIPPWRHMNILLELKVFHLFITFIFVKKSLEI